MHKNAMARTWRFLCWRFPRSHHCTLFNRFFHMQLLSQKKTFLFHLQNKKDEIVPINEKKASSIPFTTNSFSTCCWWQKIRRGHEASQRNHRQNSDEPRIALLVARIRTWPLTLRLMCWPPPSRGFFSSCCVAPGVLVSSTPAIAQKRCSKAQRQAQRERMGEAKKKSEAASGSQNSNKRSRTVRTGDESTKP